MGTTPKTMQHVAVTLLLMVMSCSLGSSETQGTHVTLKSTTATGSSLARRITTISTLGSTVNEGQTSLESSDETVHSRTTVRSATSTTTVGKMATSSCTSKDGDGASGESCTNATLSGKKRDKVLEKLVQQAWDTVDVTEGLDLGISIGDSIDPLNISLILPGGSFHVDRAGGYYKVDLWMMNISLHGLSQIYLHQVQILRSANLTVMEISAEYMLGDLV